MSYPVRTYEGAAGEGERSRAGAARFVIFAAVCMTVAGAFHVLQGLAAVIDSGYFLVTDSYAYEMDAATWGWIHLLGGVILMLAGLLLLSGAAWARGLAVFLVVASALVNFVSIPYQAIWSLVLLTLDGLILWALLSIEDSEEKAPLE